jgi:acyl carrier protein
MSPNPETIIQLINDRAILESDAELEPHTDLFTAGLDSMALMQLILHLEAGLGIKVSPADIRRENFRTPQNLALYLGIQSAA